MIGALKLLELSHQGDFSLISTPFESRKAAKLSVVIFTPSTRLPLCRLPGPQWRLSSCRAHSRFPPSNSQTRQREDSLPRRILRTSLRLIKANCPASQHSRLCLPARDSVSVRLLQELPPHTQTRAYCTELMRCPTCHPHPADRETKRKREGTIEPETGRWRDGDEGGACSACLDVNNAAEGSAANCQLLIFVVSFNHLHLRLPLASSHTPPPST